MGLHFQFQNGEPQSDGNDGNHGTRRWPRSKHPGHHGQEGNRANHNDLDGACGRVLTRKPRQAARSLPRIARFSEHPQGGRVSVEVFRKPVQRRFIFIMTLTISTGIAVTQQRSHSTIDLVRQFAWVRAGRELHHATRGPNELYSKMISDFAKEEIPAADYRIVVDVHGSQCYGKEPYPLTEERSHGRSQPNFRNVGKSFWAAQITSCGTLSLLTKSVVCAGRPCAYTVAGDYEHDI
jgi:hypothetical protein